jgi:hypothetical protein
MPINSIGDIFFQWEALEVFDFLLPFLFVFALVFGILSTTGILGKNKQVTIILAIVVALMSLRYNYFLSDFLTELFPRLGIGMGVLLAILIFVGLFIAKEEQRYWGYGLASVGAVIAIVVLHQTGQRLGWGWFSSASGSDNTGFIVLAVLLIGIIIAVATSGDNKEFKPEKGMATWPYFRGGA